jgi:hypothetical protein
MLQVPRLLGRVIPRARGRSCHLILVLMANDGIRATSPAARVAASRRFAALAIQAFQASPEASALPPTPV